MISFASHQTTKLLLLGTCLLHFGTAMAQSPLPASPLAQPEPPEANREEPPQQGTEKIEQQRQLSPTEIAEIERSIEELGSNEFAVRERAAGNLMELGRPAIPALRILLEETRDQETRFRAQEIVDRLTEGDLEAKVADFLAGRDVGFEGWRYAERQIGGAPAARELFIEMMLSHPEETKLFDGTARERAMALEGVLNNVRNRVNTLRIEPNRADLFALLLLGSDPEVENNRRLEVQMIQLSRRPTITVIRRDRQLSPQFNNLLNRWIMKTSLSNRDDILDLSMRMDLPSTLELALQTVTEEATPETLRTSMQTISKYGDRKDGAALALLLDDPRNVSRRMLGGNANNLTQVRDCAMLTIAMLYELPLSEIRMGHIETHPRVGFVPSDVAYQSEPEESRKLAMQKIKSLLTEQSKVDEAQQ